MSSRDLELQTSGSFSIRLPQLDTDASLLGTQVALAILDREGTILAVNASWQSLAALPRAAGAPWPSGMIGSNYVRDWCSIASDDTAGPALRSAFTMALSGTEPLCGCALRYPALTGPRELQVTVSTLSGSGGQVAITVSDLRAEQIALRVAATLFESRHGKMVTDAQCRIIHVNQAFCDISGYSRAEVLGHTPAMLRSGRHGADFYQAMWQTLLADGSWEGEIWNRRKNGEIFPEQLHIAAVRDAHGETSHFVGELSDISLTKAASEQIRNLAFYDPLTKLPNRRMLLDTLAQALACGAAGERTGALMVLDLDHFKNINDTLGHRTGDMLLQQVSQRLQELPRQHVLAARLGGDEFVLLLEGLSSQPLEAAASATAFATETLAALSRPHTLGAHQCRSTASIGIALFGGACTPTPEELLQQGDIAMYQAKQAGRNAFRFFDAAMQSAIGARVHAESALRKAIETDCFVLHYQVQVEHTGKARGAEALLRWCDTDGSLINPAKFIPLAEETGLILPLGTWVLDQACAQLRAWSGVPCLRTLELAINVSARQFHEAGFCELVLSAIARHGINPALLKLELTEGMLVDNIDETIATVRTLRATGVRFSLDDFGTGYSSLQYLKRLPLDQLKIDQSFVRDLVHDNSDQAIVLTIIAMARSLGLDVIAEGVETLAQRDLLHQLGCRHYQGYLFSRAIDAASFQALLAAPPAAWPTSQPCPPTHPCMCLEERQYA